jgi:integrase
MPAKIPKPFFRSGRGWYVQLGKAQIKLATGPESPATEAEAWARYHEVMVAHATAPNTPRSSAYSAGGLSVSEVCDKFLDWCQKHRAPRTYEFYRDHLQDFLTVSKAGLLPATDLKPYHVAEWADSHGTAWSPACRRGAIVAAQGPFNRAAKMGHLAASPIPHVEKPRAQRRELAVTPEDWAKIKASYPDGDPFAELLEFSWETGVRPQESKRLEARHVDLDKLRAVFPQAEAKGKRRPRVVYLTARAAEIVGK